MKARHKKNYTILYNCWKGNIINLTDQHAPQAHNAGQLSLATERYYRLLDYIKWSNTPDRNQTQNQLGPNADDAYFSTEKDELP